MKKKNRKENHRKKGYKKNQSPDAPPYILNRRERKTAAAAFKKPKKHKLLWTYPSIFENSVSTFIVFQKQTQNFLVQKNHKKNKRNTRKTPYIRRAKYTDAFLVFGQFYCISVSDLVLIGCNKMISSKTNRNRQKSKHSIKSFKSKCESHFSVQKNAAGKADRYCTHEQGEIRHTRIMHPIFCYTQVNPKVVGRTFATRKLLNK